MTDPVDHPRRYPSRPWVGIGAIILRGDAVLMVRRGKPPKDGEWSLPGGAQELGETVAQAAYREVLEETGVTIVPGDVVDVVDLIEQDGDGVPQYHYTLVDIEAEWQAGEPCAADDAADARWVPLADIADIDMWSQTRRVITLVWKKRRPPE